MNRDRGNREWLNDYMSLKQVNPENPFTAPEGYFDSLDEQILSKIKVEELKKSIPGTGLTVPANYFEELTGNIHARIRVEDALDKEASGLTVPEGYFDELSANIQARIRVGEALDKEIADFAVPEGYFDNLTDQIQSRIFVEEALSEKEGFAVPEEYFNGLTENILDKTTREKKEKKGIVIRMFSTAAFKYATAACLVLAVGATLLLNRDTNAVEEHNNSFLHQSLSAISVDDIQNYLQSHLDGDSDNRTLLDESKQIDANNLSRDLQEALDTTSQ